jgi:methylenetetrahydrofolate dehydrogenase (NADP+)/methenyltetrahydrofolate cyclohydrolase
MSRGRVANGAADRHLTGGATGRSTSVPTMSATIIDGRSVAASVRAQVAGEVAELTRRTGRPPGLATILVGEDPASLVYVAGKRRASGEVGIADHHQHLPADAAQDDVAGAIEACNHDPQISGILLQLPVPSGLDGAALTAMISPDKDVDGLTPVSAGRLLHNMPGLRPCTPLGVVELLDRCRVPLEGAEAVVVGRSDLVGKPLAMLLLHRNATVTICHSRTRELAAACSRADVLVAAAGSPGLIGPEHVKPGAAVLDVGISRTEAGLRGDVQFDAVAERAGWLTPVPGGVGPMTIAMLLANTLAAARMAAGGAEG